MVINHSITHLSEFRQVGERKGGGGEREECSGEKEKKARMELNDRERELKSSRRVRKKRRESFIVASRTCRDTGKLSDGDSL